MKKKVLVIISVFLTLILILVVTINNVDNKEKNIISNVEKDKQVINSNMITMMYETDAGTGIYEETKDNTWPESGYIFNDTLSVCENGGELEYNSENNTVNLLSNKSDRCYVYFDKYDGVWIDNVVATNLTGSSVTLDVSATSENGSITKYYYSLNDSEEYQEVTSNVITINDLNKLTEYKINIYAIDSTNAKSNIYELSVSTTDISVPVINSVEVSNITSSGFTLTVSATSTVEIKRYYYVIESENLAGTSITNIYTFNNLKYNTSYNVEIFYEDINGIYSEKYSLKINTKMLAFANYIKDLYTIDGANGLYYHIPSLINSAGDNSYRYAGANPSNYICFGSDATTCPSDNLYRIIGVFGSEVKLIKSTSYGNYQWNSNSTSNKWSTSSIRSILNTTYYNTLSNTWQNKIATHTWKVGGMGSSNPSTAKKHYDVEVGSSSNSTTWSGKIGLMYVSDYGFAANNSYWTTTLTDYNSVASSNWLCLGESEWTISPISTYSNLVFSLMDNGRLSTSYVYVGNSIRPVFYLNSEVLYISGSGTQSDPIRIN